jgi:NCAIR mutase (PurE)-related protein
VLREVLEKLARGEITLDEAEKTLRLLAVEEVGELARIDTGREIRTGIAEVIIAEGKSPAAVAEIVSKALAGTGRVVVSRISEEHLKALEPITSGSTTCTADRTGHTLVLKRKDFKVPATGGRVGVISAGTSDIPVAEEAGVMASEMGCEVLTAYDVGVAGVHRALPAVRDMIAGDVDALVVVAGREGALPTLLAGMVDVPVIAVPTSFGYGMGAGGVAALMAMLQSCSLGLAVVNIDGGIPAGAMAAMIANRAAKFRASDQGPPRA